MLVQRRLAQWLDAWMTSAAFPFPATRPPAVKADVARRAGLAFAQVSVPCAPEELGHRTLVRSLPCSLRLSGGPFSRTRLATVPGFIGSLATGSSAQWRAAS